MLARTFNLRRVLPSVLMLCILALSAFTLMPKSFNDGIKITPEEVQKMPFTQFIKANSTHDIYSCVVNVAEGKEVKAYAIFGDQQPTDLKTSLNNVKDGDIITIEKRLALVDGKQIKIPAIVYYIVAKK